MLITLSIENSSYSPRGVTDVDLKIYVLLLESGEPMSIRDIARALDLPPSTVYYHVRKLKSIGLLKESDLGYTVYKKVSFGDYLLLGNRLIPRLIIYSFFFLGLLIGQLLVIIIRGYTVDSIIAVLACLIAFIIFIAEGYKLRKRLLSK